MKENKKLISIGIALTSCRESNSHHALVSTNTKFVKFSDISYVNVYWSRNLSKKVNIKIPVKNGSESTLKDVMLSLKSIKNTVDGVNNRICSVEERLCKMEEKLCNGGGGGVTRSQSSFLRRKPKFPL